ncbi:MAG: branched-chain amino acid transport system permease protein [Frankiales bacterium]|jgi:branched-chain amino acid transport system permease protein|nr:branched-chain amino acid transport system permease protein [Frankiales bacterium]
MSTHAQTSGGAFTRARQLARTPDAARLWICLGIGALVAVIRGPAGRENDHPYAISQALKPSHLGPYLIGGVVLWVLLTRYGRNRDRIKSSTQGYRSGMVELWTRPAARYGVYLVLLVIAILLPQYGYFATGYWQGVLVEQVGVYILLAIGLNVVVGFAGLLDLGYIAFFAIGAYTAAYFTGALPADPPFTLNPFFIIPIATAVAMFSGLILGAPTLRLRGDYLAIVTLGFGEIIQILAVNLDSFTNGSRGAFGIKPFSVHTAGINYNFGLGNLPYYYLVLGFIVVVLVLFSLLENSRVGRAWTAIREDEVAAQACGIPTVKYKLMAFVIGASTSGFAGVVAASKVQFISPGDFGFFLSIFVLVFVIFGGMGSLIGSVVGVAVLQIGTKWLQLHNYIDPADLYIYFGALLILMMIFRPQGLIPSRRRARELGLAEEGIGGADAMGAPSGSPSA